MTDSFKVLLVTPPFTQMNTPYPSMMYLKGFLNTRGIDSVQADLSLEVLLDIFSSGGLRDLFNEIEERGMALSKNGRRIYALKERYIGTIDQVIAFLQGKNRTLAYAICEDSFLPKARRFVEEEDLEWAFGVIGVEEKARYLATLYMEDLSGFVQETVDGNFGFSRYAEHLGRSATSFDELEAELSKPLSFTDRYLVKRLEEWMIHHQPNLVAITIPFPGNLYSALRCGEWIKKEYPLVTVGMGGGFPNTELRSLNDARFFKYTDYLLLDDGEIPLLQLIRYARGETEKTGLVRTFCLQEREVCYINDPSSEVLSQRDVGVPDYSGLLLDKYISVIEMVNPMHKLWSDGRWNKLTLAHGCYWGKCSFCDGTLDYIKRYEPNDAKTIVDRMETIMKQTGEIGFHFVDEAAPPALLRELALEILRRQLTVVWWGNIRFEKTFTEGLCRLLKASGCIAVSGGVEVASERVLGLINKGVSLPQLIRTTRNFTGTGIMVHAYLMYGFPTETNQETIDSLEVVRQMFEQGLIQSGFWHRFAMTAHSPVGQAPGDYHVQVTEPPFGGFARNDVAFKDLKGGNHELLGNGLRVSLYNYMRGVGFDIPVQRWFDFKVPAASVSPYYVEQEMNRRENLEELLPKRLLWIGGGYEREREYTKKGKCYTTLSFHVLREEITLNLNTKVAGLVCEMLQRASVETNEIYLLNDFIRDYEKVIQQDFIPFWYGREMQNIRNLGLILV